MSATHDHDELTAPVRATLEQRAAGAIDVDVLLDQALRRGRVLSRRRHAWQATGLAVMALLIGGATAMTGGWPVGPSHHDIGDVPVTASARPSASPQPSTGLPLPPVTPAMTLDPRKIGHGEAFYLDVGADVISQAQEIQWSSFGGKERLGLSFALTGAQVALATDPSSLPGISGGTRSAMMVNGHPAEITIIRPQSASSPASTGEHAPPGAFIEVRWQPATGVWAQVDGNDESVVTRVAQAVRLDRARRCSVPFRLTWAPPGTVLTRCELIARTEQGRLELTASVAVRTGTTSLVIYALPSRTQRLEPNTTIGGRDAAVSTYPGDGGGKTMQVRIGDDDWIADLTAGSGFDEQTVLRIAAGYQASGTDPAGWPVGPLP